MGALLSDRGRGGGGSTEGLMDHKSMVSQSCHIKMIQYILAWTTNPIQKRNDNGCDLIFAPVKPKDGKQIRNQFQVLSKPTPAASAIGEVAW